MIPPAATVAFISRGAPLGSPRATPAQTAADTVAAASDPSDVVRGLDEFLAWAVDAALRLAPRILLAAVVFLAFLALAWLARSLLRRVLRRSHLQGSVADLLLALLGYAVGALGLVLALENLGLDVTSVIAGLGILGIALGFAAKDTLANLIAGITVLWDRPFRVGDRIEVAGSLGIVRRITLRTTRLDTARNEVVILPNQTMVTEKIVNHTMHSRLRVDVPFGIAYRHDVPEARRAVLESVRGDEDVLEDPAPQVVVTELASSSVNLELRIWLRDPRSELAARLRYVERVKSVLDEAGIEIPFPQLTLHVPEASPAPPPDGGAGGRTAEPAAADSARAPAEPADGADGSTTRARAGGGAAGAGESARRRGVGSE
ncbi:MAG TPA: mechanosensitive ion channel family protein [Gemmatimonadota bacterium]